MPPRVYLDYCATTPLHPQVREAMLPTLDQAYGNPSSLHWAGREAASLIENARQQVAVGIGAHPEEIIFTSGATEADNLALVGVLRLMPHNRRRLVTSAIEHHAILHSAQALEKDGYPVTYLPVNSQGIVNPEDLRHAIHPGTALVSIMWVNNEIGSLQPIAELCQVTHEHGALFHTDAVQGIGHLDVDVRQGNIDLLSLSAHKIYGPKGVGALYVRKETPIQSLTYGGSQEAGLRAGTENVPGIVGLGAAVDFVTKHKTEESQRLGQLRNNLAQKIGDTIPGSVINGPEKQVAPHVLSVSFPGSDGEMMLFHLNARGFAASMGSACTAEAIEPSHVLLAMGVPIDQIGGTLRFSFGYLTTPGQIDDLIEVLPEIVMMTKSN